MVEALTRLFFDILKGRKRGKSRKQKRKQKAVKLRQFALNCGEKTKCG
jgi:hypothetical protein